MWLTWKCLQALSRHYIPHFNSRIGISRNQDIVLQFHTGSQWLMPHERVATSAGFHLPNANARVQRPTHNMHSIKLKADTCQTGIKNVWTQKTKKCHSQLQLIQLFITNVRNSTRKGNSTNTSNLLLNNHCCHGCSHWHSRDGICSNRAQYSRKRHTEEG